MDVVALCLDTCLPSATGSLVVINVFSTVCHSYRGAVGCLVLSSGLVHFFLSFFRKGVV